MYDEVERAVTSGDAARIERSLADMKDRFGASVYAEQAALLAAKAYYQSGNLDAAKSALVWVADKGADESYNAIAKLRLSGLLLEAKAYDDALKLLAGPFPKDFVPLASDRRGDILLLQGKKSEAKTEYEKAYKGLEERAEYRRLVEVKLNSLGADPAGVAAGNTAPIADSGTKK